MQYSRAQDRWNPLWTCSKFWMQTYIMVKRIWPNNTSLDIKTVKSVQISILANIKNLYFLNPSFRLFAAMHNAISCLDLFSLLLHFCLIWKLKLWFYINNVLLCSAVRGTRPGKNVQLTESEIRGLCLKSRELFLSQPILLELEAPLKICGKLDCNCCPIRYIYSWHSSWDDMS